MLNWKKCWSNVCPWYRRCFYPLVSVLVAISLVVYNSLPTPAFQWIPLILQGVQVVQLSHLSDRQEVELGKQMNKQLASKVHFYHNPEINSYIQKIGKRLAAHSTRPNIPYVFQIVDDNAINAFATTGGFIYLNKGLLKAADNEAQVAAVMGHEMGHIEAKHLLQQMRHQAFQQGLLAASGLNRSQAINMGLNLSLTLPLSRKDEYEADKRGLQNITRSGYSQTAMVSFMQKLLSKGASPAFLSTHPGTGDRIKALKSEIAEQPRNNADGLNNSLYQTNVRNYLR